MLKKHHELSATFYFCSLVIVYICVWGCSRERYISSELNLTEPNIEEHLTREFTKGPSNEMPLFTA